MYTVNDIYYPKKKDMIKYYAICMPGLAFTGWLFFDNLIAVVALCFFAIPFKKYWIKSFVEKKKKELSLQFKDMLFSLSASFQSGRHMEEAITEAKTNMSGIYPPDAPINIELGLMVKRMGMGGESEREVLFDFAKRSGNDDAKNFADVYYTCLTTGGDLVSVVNRTAEVILEKISIRREIDTLMAQKQYEAKLLTVVPFLILLYLRFSSPGYLEQLYTTFAGLCIMATALGALVVSFLWSGKIMDIKV